MNTPGNPSQPDEENIDPIQQYVDGELSGGELASFDARLQSDGELKRRVESETEFIGAVRDALSPEPLPADYENEIRALIGRHWSSDESTAVERAPRPAPMPAKTSMPAKRSASKSRSGEARRSGDDARRPAAGTQRPWARHPLSRVAAIAATLLIVVSAVSLLRDDSPESDLPWIVADSIDVFSRALGSPARAAEPPLRPKLKKCDYLTVHCEGERRDGKLNPCILFKGPNGVKLGYFCLDDRVDDTEFFEREPVLVERGYTIVRCGPPGALHIWIAKGLTPEMIAAMIEPSAPADADNPADAEIHVESMSCAGCAHHIARILRTLPGVADVRCNVEERIARVWFDDSAKGTTTHTTIVELLNRVGHIAE